MLRILIAGLGSIGRRHLSNLQALGKHDVVLFRTYHSTLRDEDLPGLQIETDLEQALAHKPAAVIVANPTAVHLEVAVPAVRAGCHLLIEKPVSHSMDGINILTAAVQASKVRVLVGYQFRFHPGLQIVKRLLDEGAIGSAVSVDVHIGEYLLNWHPWEDYRLGYSARTDLGGGVILTLCHPFDYLRWLIGDVAEVSAMVAHHSVLGIDAEETADINLRFVDDTLGHIHLDYIKRPPSHWLQITGQTGTIHWDNTDGAVRCYRAQTDREEIFSASDDFERNTMFLNEIAHFLACVEGREQPFCTLNDGIQALHIALAAKRSAAEGRIIQLSNERCVANF